MDAQVLVGVMALLGWAVFGCSREIRSQAAREASGGGGEVGEEVVDPVAFCAGLSEVHRRLPGCEEGFSERYCVNNVVGSQARGCGSEAVQGQRCLATHCDDNECNDLGEAWQRCMGHDPDA